MPQCGKEPYNRDECALSDEARMQWRVLHSEEHVEGISSIEARVYGACGFDLD